MKHCNGNNRLAEGERRKDDILKTLSALRDSIINRARRVLLDKCLLDGIASADDVRAAVELPKGIDARCLGSVPGPLARAHIIRRADFSKSARPERHASYISEWEIADPEAARQWLATHPNRPDPAPPEKNRPTVTAAGLFAGGAE